MNRDLLLLAMLAFLAGIILGRYLTQRASRLLGSGQKAMVAAQLRRLRLFQVLPTAAVLIGFVLLMDSPAIKRQTLAYIAFGALAVISTWQTVDPYLRLKRLRMPADFLREFMVSRLVQLAGLLVFCVLLLWQVKR